MTAPHAPSQGVLSCLCPLPGKVSHWSPSQQATEDTLTTHPPPTPTHSRLLEKLFLSVHSEPLGCLKGTQVEDKPSETIRRQKGAMQASASPAPDKSDVGPWGRATVTSVSKGSLLSGALGKRRRVEGEDEPARIWSGGVLAPFSAQSSSQVASVGLTWPGAGPQALEDDLRLAVSGCPLARQASCV